MTILLTGSSGKTASRIAELLHTHGLPFLVASRKPEAVPAPYTGVRFDWNDEQTWDNPFSGSPIKRVYLVAPPVTNPLPIMRKFIEHAHTKGAERFVLLSGSPVGRGGPLLGEVHDYLAGSGLEYAVLRPTWFMENFIAGPNALAIKQESKVYSATDKGLIPWISTYDIAAVAVEALTTDESYNTDVVLIGRELLSYDDVASILTEVLGRKITHDKLSYDASISWWTEKRSMSPAYATLMAKMDLAIEAGSEQKWAKEPVVALDEWPVHRDAKVVWGNTTMRQIVEENKHKWLA